MLDLRHYQLETVDPLIEEYARGERGPLRVPQLLAGPGRDDAGRLRRDRRRASRTVEWQYADLFFRNQDAAPNGTVTTQFLDDIGNAIDSFRRWTWASGTRTWTRHR